MIKILKKNKKRLKEKGFTLVELLSVIVILAIIMIIAIPAVLQTMYLAKKRSFENYAIRIVNETIKQYTEDNMKGTYIETKIYNIQKELGLGSTGDFKGYSLISPNSNTVYLTLYDTEYALVATKIENKKLSEEYKQLSKIDPYKLTPEYLCSIVEECTNCSYLKIDEDGNESYELITPEKHEYDGILGTSSNIRNTVNSLVPLENITEIKYSETIPEGDNKKNIADSKSKEEIYVWNEGTIIYYGTEGNNIFFAPNSQNIFKDLTSVKHIDTIKWRMDEIVSAQNMFYGCSSLESIDTSNWKFTEATNLSGLFNRNRSLTHLDLKDWNAKKVTTIFSMLYDCVSLNQSIDLSNWSFENLTNISYAFACKDSKEQMLIEYITLPNTSNQVSNMEAAFTNCKRLKRIYNIENFKGSSITIMALAFKNCESLEELNFSNWSVSKLETIDWAFQNCLVLKKLDFRNFSFARVKSLNGAFYNAKALEEVLFGSKDFQSLTTAENMFTSTSIKEMDLSNANMPNVTSIANMFYSCASLTKLNLSNIKATSLVKMSKTFYGLTSLPSINLSGFEAPVLEDMTQAFDHCTLITSLDLSSLNARNVQSLNMAFFVMSSLETINLTGIKSKVTNMINTFNSNSNLKTIYVSKEFSNENIPSDKKTSTFYKCTSLPGYTTSKINSDYAKPISEGGYLTVI